MLTLDDLRRRCVIDPITNCWHWQGAKSVVDGVPRLYTFDHARCEKRTMSGPVAAWNIAHQRAPLPGWKVYRCCGTTDCLAPYHLREVRNTKEMGRLIAASGRRKGAKSEAVLAAAARGRAAQGIVETPREIVLQIRAAPLEISGAELARQLGIPKYTVSRIRRGESFKGVVA